MAKSKKQPETAKDDDNRSPSWNIYARIDPALHGPVDLYIAAQKYPPALARVIERALKMLLEEEGFWPPEGGDA